MAATPTFPDDYETSAPVYRAPVRLSWGALFGGIFVTLGAWVLLNVLGLAIGLSSIDPNDPHSLKAVGIGAGIWSAIVPIVSLFVGGMVAARSAGIVDRATGSLHGFVLWGVTIVASLALTGMIVRGLVGVATNVGSGVATAAAQVEGKGAKGAPDVGAAHRIDEEQRTSLERTGQQIETKALQAGESTGHAMWWAFLGMVLGLVAAVGGSTLGVSRKQRLAATERVPLATTREVHG